MKNRKLEIAIYWAALIGGLWSLIELTEFIVDFFEWPKWTLIFFYTSLILLSTLLVLASFIIPFIKKRIALRQNRIIYLPLFKDLTIGRKADLKKLKFQVSKNKLISIIGEGGAGKTHLALSFITKHLKNNLVDIYFFNLESIQDRDNIISMICRSFNINYNPETGTQNILNFLRNKNTLLIFDNCEHVNTICGEIIRSLLLDSKSVKVLVTSRNPLNIPGESIIKINGLELPIRNISINKFIKNPSVRLFMHYSGFSISDIRKNKLMVSFISNIIHFTQGLPLAIKIISSQTKIMNFNELTNQTNKLLLFSQSENASKRQNRMLDSIEWSFNILKPDEQEFLISFTLFHGDVSLNALYFIFGEINANIILKKLIDLTLINKVESTPQTRFAILPLLRIFLNSKLNEHKNKNVLEQKYAQYYRNFAKNKIDLINTSNIEYLLDELDLEMYNLVKSMKYYISLKEYNTMIEFMGLYWHWFLRGYWKEMSGFIRELVELRENFEKSKKARVLLSYGTMLWANGQLIDAEKQLIEAEGICSSIDDKKLTSEIQHILGHVYDQSGQTELALSFYKQSTDYWQKIGNHYWLALLLDDIGAISIELGDFKLAEEVLLRAKTLSESHSIKHALGNAFMHLGILERIKARNRKAYRASKRYFNNALQVFSSIGYSRGEASANRHKASLEIKFGKLREALKCIETSLKTQQSISHKIGIAWSLETLALVECRRHNYNNANIFMNHANTIRDESNSKLFGLFKKEKENLQTEILEHLDKDKEIKLTNKSTDDILNLAFKISEPSKLIKYGLFRR